MESLFCSAPTPPSSVNQGSKGWMCLYGCCYFLDIVLCPTTAP